MLKYIYIYECFKLSIADSFVHAHTFLSHDLFQCCQSLVLCIIRLNRDDLPIHKTNCPQSLPGVSVFLPFHLPNVLQMDQEAVSLWTHFLKRPWKTKSKVFSLHWRNQLFHPAHDTCSLLQLPCACHSHCCIGCVQHSYLCIAVFAEYFAQEH